MDFLINFIVFFWVTAWLWFPILCIWLVITAIRAMAR